MTQPPEPAEPRPGTVPTTSPDAEEAPSDAWTGRGSAVALGALLIAAGIILLIGQQLDLDIADIGWPFFVIAPGVALIILGLVSRETTGLTVAGSIVTIVGLVLLYQNATNHWESWAYAWALVGPGGSGVGMLLAGLRSADADAARAGGWQIVTALALFLAGFVFFEGILRISGRELPIPDWVAPVLVIAFGAVLLVRGFAIREGPRSH